MRQQRFNFGRRTPRLTLGDPAWPAITSENREKYPSPLLQRAAAMALHRLGRPHYAGLCLYCERENARNAA